MRQYRDRQNAGKSVGDRIADFVDRHMCGVFITPAFLVTILLLAYPICISVYYSFTNKSLLGKAVKFVGFNNYVSVLQNPEFYHALWNTLVYTVISLSLQLFFGFIVALSLHKINRFKGMFRTLVLIPWAFPMIIVTFTWSYLLNDLYGIVNAKLLHWNLIAQPIQFLANPKIAMLTVSLINVWFGVPLFAINILASLQTISRDLYEAARIDGANRINCFFKITVPMLSPTIFLCTVMQFISSLQVFDTIMAMTQGGPGRATNVLTYYIYQRAFVDMRFGYASAVAYVLFVIILVITLIQFVGQKKWVNY